METNTCSMVTVLRAVAYRKINRWHNAEVRDTCVLERRAEGFVYLEWYSYCERE